MGVGVLLGGQSGLIIGLLIGLVFVGGSYWFSDKLAIKAARAVPATREEFPELYAIVEELAAEARHARRPRIYVSPEMQPNAFATGRSPRHAAVAVTPGILQVLDRDELARRPRPRAVAREEPRHPHRIGRCRGRDGHSLRGEDRVLGRACSVAVTTTTAATRSARSCHADPRARSRPRSPDGDLALRASSRRTRPAPSCCTMASRSPAHSRRSRRTRSRCR